MVDTFFFYFWPEISCGNKKKCISYIFFYFSFEKKFYIMVFGCWWLAGLMECIEAVENFLFGYWGLELTEVLGIELSGYWVLELSGYWSLELSGYRDLELSGYCDVETSGNGGLEPSEICDPEWSGYWGLESNGYWGSGLPLSLELSKCWEPALSMNWGLQGDHFKMGHPCFREHNLS